jgi:hypothetical protein
MSKGLKTVLPIVAAIAIPFAAPAIASSIGLSGALAGTFGAVGGSIAGSALTGAALGATNAAVFGGDVSRGALMGGVSGGVSGYFNPPAVNAAAPAATASTAAAPTAAAPQALSLAGGTPTMAAGAPTTAAGAPQAFNLSGSATGLPASAFAPSQPFNITGVAPTATTNVTAATAPTMAGLSGLSAAQLGTVASAAPAGLSMAGVAPAATTVAGAEPSFGQQVLGSIKERFTDPKAVADMTLRAAGVLAGSYIAGDGMSSEERALLNQQIAELSELRQANSALFNERLQQAQNLIGESRYFDPEYFGLQRARQAQVAGARARRAGLRGLTGGAREAESRRFDLAIGRDVGTAYDQGFNTGVQGRLSAMQAGLGAYPEQYPSSANEFSQLRTSYDQASRRARETREGIGTLFGSLT